MYCTASLSCIRLEQVNYGRERALGGGAFVCSETKIFWATPGPKSAFSI